jgi:NADPH2 dehydrogenase
MMRDYYTQRASVPGTLIIAEATFVSPNIGGYANGPGIWNEDQVAWREITDNVHRKGSFIFCQLGLLGRTADADMSRDAGVPFFAPSAIPMDENAAVPRAMTVEEIKKTVHGFGEASEKAVRAGFDGVEIHGALGYLLDQFLKTSAISVSTNMAAAWRTDPASSMRSSRESLTPLGRSV